MNFNSPNPDTKLHLNATSYPDVPNDIEHFYHNSIAKPVNYFSAKEVNSSCTNFPTSVITVYNCEFIVDVYVTTFLCFVGFLGNSLTIAVLRRDREPRTHKSTNWLLETLAIVDITFLAFAFIFLPIRTIALRSETLPTVIKILPYLLMYLYPFAAISHTVTIWIVILVTIDRYLAVCRPLHPEWRSLRRVKMAVGVLFLLAVIYNIPRFFEFKVEMKENCEDGELRPFSVARTFVRNVYYQYIYEAGCDFVFTSVGPLVILVILNVRICWAIKDLNKKRREMTLQAKEEKSLTVMLIIVVIIFVICQLPMSVLSMAFPTAVFFPTTVNWKAFACAFETSNALNVLNSSINFLVYCLIWRKFNRILVRMMACCKDKANGLI